MPAPNEKMPPARSKYEQTSDFVLLSSANLIFSPRNPSNVSSHFKSGTVVARITEVELKTKASTKNSTVKRQTKERICIETNVPQRKNEIASQIKQEVSYFDQPA